MMQEESGGATHGKVMAHDNGDGHDSGHNMMDPAHVAHCIGYIAQVSFQIEPLLPSFDAGLVYNARDVQCHFKILSHAKMTADASWRLRSSIFSVPPTARSSLHGSNKTRRETLLQA